MPSWFPHFQSGPLFTRSPYLQDGSLYGVQSVGTTASCSSYPHAGKKPAGHCAQRKHSPLLFSLKPASQSQVVQLVLDEFPAVAHLACAGLPWQGAHKVSWVLLHGHAVYLPTPQFVQATHCVPVENVLPWQLPHTESRVSEHGDTVYEPSPTQLAQVTHCVPVQNSLPLRHPPAARTLAL
jgi:hypothetical protein